MDTSLESYFVREGGLYAFYTYEEGVYLKKFSTRQVAVAYDTQHLVLRKLGVVEDTMRWAAEERTSLRQKGADFLAECLAVILLNRDHDVIELNKLVEDSTYLTTFLQKAGVV